MSDVDVAVDGAIARVRLNRPDRLNALSTAVVATLYDIARRLDDNPAVRVVLLSGAGRMFSAGADLGESATMLTELRAGTFSPARARHEAELGRQMLDAIEGMRAVTVALVHRAAIGAGVSLATACDLRVLTTDARLTLPELDLGLPLAWGATARLVRELGPGLTRAMLLTGAPLTSAEAVERGFALAVVAPDALEKYGEELAQSLAARPAYAVSVMKRRVTAIARSLSSAEFASVEAAEMVAALADSETLAALEARLAAVLAAEVATPLAN